MSALRRFYLPLYALKVGHQLGKLRAYLTTISGLGWSERGHSAGGRLLARPSFVSSSISTRTAATEPVTARGPLAGDEALDQRVTW